MKKLAQAVLYVSSIALAIGIGMGQAGKSVDFSFVEGDQVDCPILSVESNDCIKNTNSSYSCYAGALFAHGRNYGSRYRYSDEIQCRTYHLEGGIQVEDNACSKEGVLYLTRSDGVQFENDIAMVFLISFRFFFRCDHEAL